MSCFKVGFSEFWQNSPTSADAEDYSQNQNQASTYRLSLS